MRLIYNLGVGIYTIIIHLAAMFSPKSRLWVRGRRGWEKKLRSAIDQNERVYWFHCASLGEFEQGRPVIEKLRLADPELKIVLTFFSPSGYEIRKGYESADHILYLPADSPYNARRFLEILKPEKAVFVKYEFWYNYLEQLQENNIPVYLISGIFRPGQPFFKWYGKHPRKILSGFKHLFIQNDSSAKLLDKINIKNFTVCGDTRFDRVFEISKRAEDLKAIEKFKGSSLLFLAGSSWPPDEEIITKYINSAKEDIKWVFAPHEVHKSNIERLAGMIDLQVVRYSERENAGLQEARVLIIDNIGILSSAYKYADIAAVGGGFGKGIHNILEPATWGIPVLFGPRHEKFMEAIRLIDHEGGFSFDSYNEFKKILDRLITDESYLKRAGNSSLSFIKKNLGASATICTKLLT